jgi:hypothetical protein
VAIVGETLPPLLTVPPPSVPMLVAVTLLPPTTEIALLDVELANTEQWVAVSLAPLLILMAAEAVGSNATKQSFACIREAVAVAWSVGALSPSAPAKYRLA